MAPELLAELGEPYRKLWQVLACTHGEREGARVLSKILAAVLDHGEQAVRQAIEQALAAGWQDLLALAPRLHQAPVQRKVKVPVGHYRGIPSRLVVPRTTTFSSWEVKDEHAGN